MKMPHRLNHNTIMSLSFSTTSFFLSLIINNALIIANKAEDVTSPSTLERKLYNGDHVLRVFPATQTQFSLLGKLLSGVDAFDDRGMFVEFWTEPKAVGVPADLYVRHDKLMQIVGFLDLAKIAHTVLVDDVQRLIERVEESDKAHRVLLSTRRRRDLPTSIASGDLTIDKAGPDIVGRYASYADMARWLEAQCIAYPKLTECGSYGTSFEGRDLRYIRIGFAQAQNPEEKRSIFIEGGIHAREWLSPATVIFLINKMLTSYETDQNVKEILDSFEFYIVPSTNPDGYEYSRTKERLWRKTRSNTSSPICFGVDGNRNYPIRWSQAGSESSPCSNVYHGPRPLSEPETKALSELVTSDRQKWLAFFSIHSYSQFWLVPYGFEPGAKPGDYDELVRVANIGASALMAANGGTRIWEVGNTVNLTYPCSGSSDDWSKAIVGIRYTYTLELFPSSNSLTGFVVGESQIEPSGREVFAGLLAAINAMKMNTEENVADPIAFQESAASSLFSAFNEPSGGDDEEFSFTVNELQIILNKLALDLKTLMQRVDELDSTFATDARLLRERANRLETQMPKFDAKLTGLDSNIDTVWKALSSTQTRQMGIQRQLLDDSLVVIITPRFVPHTINKESLIGELVKVADPGDESFIEAMRKLDIEEVVELRAKTVKPRTWVNYNGSEENLREFLLEGRRFRGHHRAVLLGPKSKATTEKAGYWFEPQYTAEERGIKRAFDAQISKMKAQFGDSLKYTMKGLKLSTNQGEFYYDTVSKKVLSFGTGRGNGNNNGNHETYRKKH